MELDVIKNNCASFYVSHSTEELYQWKRRTNEIKKFMRVYFCLIKSQLKSKVILQEAKLCSSKNL
jgi:hypothetical protein